MESTPESSLFSRLFSPFGTDVLAGELRATTPESGSPTRARQRFNPWLTIAASRHEITGARRDETLTSFASRRGWYRGSEVDRLSEEAAGVIVDPLLRRAIVAEPTIGGKANSLKPDLLKVIRERLTGCSSTDCRRKFTEIARQSLNARKFNALMEAEKQGYLPVGDEQ